MKPNIDRKGRIARAISGVLTIAFGGGIWLFDWPATASIRWIVTGVAVLAGLFQLYEAKRAWCVTRACGIKTPM